MSKKATKKEDTISQLKKEEQNVEKNEEINKEVQNEEINKEVQNEEINKEVQNEELNKEVQNNKIVENKRIFTNIRELPEYNNDPNELKIYAIPGQEIKNQTKKKYIFTTKQEL